MPFSLSPLRHGLSAVILLLFLAIPMASAQLQTGSLFGTVLDEEDRPVPGVTVTLSGAGAPQVQVSDSQGRFRFMMVSVSGPYQLKAELEGFAPVEYSNVVVSVGRNTEIEIRLSAGIEDEVTVASEAPPTGGAGGGSPERGYREVPVFYGTDRFATGSKKPDTAFSNQRSRARSLHLGVCRVSVPRSHQPGMIEEPSIWRLQFRPDPSKHLVLLDREPLSSRLFFERIQGTLGRSVRKELLVFVHGFNVSFKDAVLRTAQLATDLRIDGVPVVYSWPSEASLLGYMVDSNNAEWTIQHLEPFLRDLSQRSGASSIYLVAHSMGNRPLTRALERIALQLTAASPSRPPFSQILLTAPDIDAEVFADLARSFHRIGERVTLYASSQDVALNVSNWVNKYPRAGDSGEGMPVASNVDIIDVSSIDSSLRGFGHSYYGDNCTVLSDIYRLLRDRQPPKLRGLNQIDKGGVAYWVMQAVAACPP